MAASYLFPPGIPPFRHDYCVHKFCVQPIINLPQSILLKNVILHNRTNVLTPRNMWCFVEITGFFCYPDHTSISFLLLSVMLTLWKNGNLVMDLKFQIYRPINVSLVLLDTYRNRGVWFNNVYHCTY